jgi:hypothetical protein
MSVHLGETAALYALGVLDDDERREADEHLDGCDACRRLLAQAQDDVTAMEVARGQNEPLAAPARLRKLPSAWLAIAAAIVIAIGPTGYLLHQNAVMHSTMAADAEAMARVASTPHRVASFSGVDAHVMYGSDGSWYFVVIRGARAGLNVVWPHDGVQTMLGTAQAHGEVALLYLPKSHRMDRLTIVQDGHVLGQAQLVF